VSLARLLDAKSVAVIGASRDEKKRGFQTIRALMESKFEGPIYPVNPHEETILGLKCYPSILHVEDPVDLGFICTPAETLPAIVADCGRMGLAGVVVIAGGFGELGRRGRQLQAKIVNIAEKAGMRLLGPNTSGIINVHSGLNLAGIDSVPKGNMALVSQSGNMALHMITEARLKSQKGFSYYVGVGNEADIKFHEYLEKFTDDPKTKAIVMYVEGLKDGRRFLQQAYLTTLKKPIILLKGGRSTRGSKSVGSHTGALAGISEVSRTAFKRAGIVTVENSDELFPVAEALTGLPPIRNGKIAILADGGGHATIAADVLSEQGLKIPELNKESRQKLATMLSPNASLHNPVDIAGSADSDPGLFADCARILLSNDQIGGLLVVGLFGGYGMRFAERLRFIEEDAAHRMGKLVQETGKPIVLQSLYNFAHPHAHDLLRYYCIPVFDSVEIACRCIAALSEYGHYLGTFHHRTNFVFCWGTNAKDTGTKIIKTAASEGRHMLLEYEAKQLLGSHGVPVTDDRLARTANEAEAVAAQFDAPVVLKICSPDISHKSDVGGVRLGLETAGQVRKAFGQVVRQAKHHHPNADIRGCLISPMVDPGTEVIVGTKIDPQFGPVIMFGIGGILVEVLKDVVFRVLPLSRGSAQQMLHEIRSAPILNGVRGQSSVDREALVDLLLAVADIIESYPRIKEMDLNPVILFPEGLTVVDARIVLKKNYRE